MRPSVALLIAGSLCGCVTIEKDPPPDTITILPDEHAMGKEVRKYLWPGMPTEEAENVLKRSGFSPCPIVNTGWGDTHYYRAIPRPWFWRKLYGSELVVVDFFSQEGSISHVFVKILRSDNDTIPGSCEKDLGQESIPCPTDSRPRHPFQRS
jgi:hypothetical protein